MIETLLQVFTIHLEPFAPAVHKFKLNLFATCLLSGDLHITKTVKTNISMLIYDPFRAKSNRLVDLKLINAV